MSALIMRIIGTLPLTIGSIMGIAQVAIKFIKEVLTLCVNLLFPLFPDGGAFENTVLKIRNIINKADLFVEKIKQMLLKITGLKTS
jgi:hypothetical protein